MPIAAGKSSFDLVDFQKICAEINAEKGITLVDIACGSGRYALALAEHFREKMTIIAYDLWEEGIASLQQTALEKNIDTIHPSVVDVTTPLPLENASVDYVLIATFLHDLREMGKEDAICSEIKRILKKDGTLLVVEFLKIDGPPGPKKEIRLSREETRELLQRVGLKEVKYIDLGTCTCLSVFRAV